MPPDQVYPGPGDPGEPPRPGPEKNPPNQAELLPQPASALTSHPGVGALKQPGGGKSPVHLQGEKPPGSRLHPWNIFSLNKLLLGVPTVAQQKQTQLVSMRTKV